MQNKYTSVKERCLYYVKIKGIRVNVFLDSIQMTYGSFKGKAKKGSLNSDALVKVYTQYPDINIHWLLTGEGEMLRNINDDITEKKLESSQTSQKEIDDILDLKKIISSKDQQIIDAQALTIDVLKLQMDLLKNENQKSIHLFQENINKNNMSIDTN